MLVNIADVFNEWNPDEYFGHLELSGSPRDEKNPPDTINSSYIRDNCPTPATKPKKERSKKLLKDCLRIAKEARSVGLHEFANKLAFCCCDVIILRDSKGKYSCTPLKCDHKLCPICHSWHAYDIRKRLEEVIHRARLMVTFTFATYKDEHIRKNIKVLCDAFRDLYRKRNKRHWTPFDNGYFWRLEVTDGLGYHPHLHVLSPHYHIDYYHLRKAWRSCIDRAGGKGDLIWIEPVNSGTPKEVCKYLSKDINHIETSRWVHLYNGLWKKRTYGSGKALKLPKREYFGKSFVSFGHEVNNHSPEELKKFIWEGQIHLKMRPDAELISRYTDEWEYERFYEPNW